MCLSVRSVHAGVSVCILMCMWASGCHWPVHLPLKGIAVQIQHCRYK